MKVGVSLTPGGLLLPYHVGVLEALEYNGFLTPETPLAGSSAGSIAVASSASGVSPQQSLEATIDISNRCAELGGARGRLLPLLREKLNTLVTDDNFQQVQERPGAAVVAYKELLPRNQPILQYKFSDRDDFIQAVCNSSMFPFFSTNWPATIDTSKRFPRVVVDGFFTVPRERFGAPDFDMVEGVDVDRTILISCFPQDRMRIDAVLPEDCISPMSMGGEQLERLFRIATQPSSREELTSVYEEGYQDAEKWLRAESKSRRTKPLGVEQGVSR